MLTRFVFILQILFLSSLSQNHQLMQRCGDVYPPENHIAVGGSLNLTCVLNKNTLGKNWTARHVYFVLGNEPRPSKFYRIIADGQLNYYQPNITETDGGSSYKCLLKKTRGLTDPDDCAVTGWVGSAMVATGYPPSTVDSVTCTSSNFMNMTCTWCSPIVGSYVLNYTINGTSESGTCQCEVASSLKFPCNHGTHGNCKCEFCASQNSSCKTGAIFYPNRLYKIDIIGKNEFGTRSSTHMVNTDTTIVKPGPVTNLRLVSRSSEHVTVTWSPPDWPLKSISLIYIVKCMSQTGCKQELNTSSGFLNITHLKPYTNYTISVTSQSEKGALRSEQSVIKATTQQDVPRKAPMIPPGGYHERESSCQKHNQGRCRSVTVYWQGVSNEDSNGEIKNYTLRVENLQKEIWTQKADAGDRSCMIENLLYGHQYTVSLSAYTSVGSSPVTSFTIAESDNDGVENAEAEVTEDENHVLVTWSVNMKSLTVVRNYTLLWCSGNVIDGCKNNPSYQIYDRNTTKGYVKLANKFERPLVAVAVNYGQFSSGMSLWICIYEHHIAPSSPEWHFAEEQNERSLTLEWDRLGCVHGDSNKKVRVTAYVISWQRCQPSSREHNCSGFENSSSIEATSMNFTIKGLSPNTIYAVTLYAKSGSLDGVPDTKYNSTPQSAPDEQPNIVTFTSVTSTSFTLKWSSCLFENGDILYYMVTQREASGDGVRETRVKELNFTASALEGYTTYLVWIRCCNTAGCSPRSRKASITTFMRAPARIASVVVTVTSPSSVNVTWTAPNPANGVITSYQIIINRMDHHFQRNVNVSAPTYSRLLDFPCSEWSSSPVKVSFSLVAFVENTTHTFASEPSFAVNKTICETATFEREYWPYIVILPALALLIVFAILIRNLLRKLFAKRNITISAPPRVPIPVPNCDMDQNDNDGIDEVLVPHTNLIVNNSSLWYRRFADINVQSHLSKSHSATIYQTSGHDIYSNFNTYSMEDSADSLGSCPLLQKQDGLCDSGSCLEISSSIEDRENENTPYQSISDLESDVVYFQEERENEQSYSINNNEKFSSENVSLAEHDIENIRYHRFPHAMEKTCNFLDSKTSSHHSPSLWMGSTSACQKTHTTKPDLINSESITSCGEKMDNSYDRTLYYREPFVKIEREMVIFKHEKTTKEDDDDYSKLSILKNVKNDIEGNARKYRPSIPNRSYHDQLQNEPSASFSYVCVPENNK